MKKWLIGVMTVLMAVSLAACTPTTEKQKKETACAPQRHHDCVRRGGVRARGAYALCGRRLPAGGS